MSPGRDKKTISVTLRLLEQLRPEIKGGLVNVKWVLCTAAYELFKKKKFLMLVSSKRMKFMIAVRGCAWVCKTEKCKTNTKEQACHNEGGGKT